MSDSEEEDYLSDRILQSVEQSSCTKRPGSYEGLRKAALARSEAAQARNRQLFRVELEEERQQAETDAREEKLNTNLMLSEGPNSKAVSMMMKMGFQLGQSLGAKRPLDEENSQLSSVIAESRKRLVVPLKPVLPISQRGGIGVARNTIVKPSLTGGASSVIQNEAPLIDFRALKAQEFAEKEIARELSSVRALLRQLDEEKGLQFHKLWLDAEDMDQCKQFLQSHVSTKDNNKAAEDLRATLGISDDIDDEEIQISLDSDEEDDDNVKQLNGIGTLMDPGLLSFLAQTNDSKLELSLEYLRATHDFCFHCGCYGLLDCPGVDRESHE